VGIGAKEHGWARDHPLVAVPTLRDNANACVARITPDLDKWTVFSVCASDA
jgi:hypothetical protein